MTAGSRTIKEQTLYSIIIESLLLFLEERILETDTFELFEVSRVSRSDANSVHYLVEFCISVLVQRKAIGKERILVQSFTNV